MHRFQDMQLLRCGAFMAAASLLNAATGTVPALSPRMIDSYGKLPLSFEANRGQTARQVKFLSRGRGYTLFLTESATAVLSLHGQEANAVLRMNLRGANAHARVAGADPLPGKSNYYIGSDPSQWRTDIPTYSAVKYTAVYPGIDLVYHGNQQLLEYDFVVAPGADPQAIDIGFEGAQKLSVNGDGALVIGVGGNEVIEHAPVVYQEIAGRRQTLAGRYVLRGKGRVGFRVAEYDRSRALVIDPTLVYSTHLGGSGSDQAFGIAVDATGSTYVTGITDSADFPTTPGAFGTALPAPVFCCTFVTKLNAAGSALVYSALLGSSTGWAIAVDSAGNAYVTGDAGSGFPTTPGAFQTTFGGAFVTKLNATGSALAYSTLLGGHGRDGSRGIAVDASGNAYVTGYTFSMDFSTTPGAFQRTLNGTSDAFVTKLNATGSALAYSTLLGGRSGDGGQGIAVDAPGDAYVTGYTLSMDFPATPGAFQRTLNGTYDAFVTKLNATGSALAYSTLLGGTDGAEGYGIAVDASGAAYLTGIAGPDFPTSPGAFQMTCGLSYAFVTKLNPGGSALVYSTCLGAPAGGASGSSIAVDASGNAYVTGTTISPFFPTTPGALRTTLSGINDAFLTKLNATGSALLYSTYLGGQGVYIPGGSGQPYSMGLGVAVDTSGNAYVTGQTALEDFSGAFLGTNSGGVSDVFVTKLDLSAFSYSGPLTTANVRGPIGNNGWYLGAVTVTLAATAGKSPVSATYYSIDGDQKFGPYQAYGGPFSISTAGIHRLFYYSVDTSGVYETPPEAIIKIDAKPVSRVAALPATATSPNFSVQWSGTGATTGIASYSIYVSDSGKPFARWLSNVTSTQAWYSGSLLHTYAFYSSATDVAGNVENKTAADATTRVPQMPGDVNGDGKIDCTDIAIVKAALGKRIGQPGFVSNADVNGDGVVDVRDLSIVSQKLAPGTKCP